MEESSPNGFIQLGSDIDGASRREGTAQSNSARFGWTVDINGDGTVIAATNWNCTVHVYENLGEEIGWKQVGNTITPNEDHPSIDPCSNDVDSTLPISLSRDGMIIAIGIPGSWSGRVQVYEYDRKTQEWTKYGQLLENSGWVPDSGDRYGRYVQHRNRKVVDGFSLSSQYSMACDVLSFFIFCLFAGPSAYQMTD